jgi:hypothetical protein
MTDTFTSEQVIIDVRAFDAQNAVHNAMKETSAEVDEYQGLDMVVLTKCDNGYVYLARVLGDRFEAPMFIYGQVYDRFAPGRPTDTVPYFDFTN